MMDPLPMADNGVQLLSQEINTAMSIVTKYKPESHGGDSTAWEDYHQIQEDVLHLAALHASIAPLSGQLSGDEKLADYTRELSRDRVYESIRTQTNPATGKVYSSDDATRMARVQTAEQYNAHAEHIRQSAKITSFMFSIKDMIETLNRYLDRVSRERRSNGGH